MNTLVKTLCALPLVTLVACSDSGDGTIDLPTIATGGGNPMAPVNPSSVPTQPQNEVTQQPAQPPVQQPVQAPVQQPTQPPVQQPKGT